jgi:hypothetical protein
MIPIFSLERNSPVFSSLELIPSTTNLRIEEELMSLACVPIDFDRRSPLYKHYTIPNEFGVRQIVPHFNPREGGIHFCVGTERLFSNAAQSPRRDGFVGIDFDPHVIAYNNFNALLLRISSHREEFHLLATMPGEPSTMPWNERIEEIRRRIESSDLLPEWKKYYSDHLETFAEIYYPAKKAFFELVEQYPSDFIAYHKDQEAFEKLQDYARQGMFVFLYGEINRLDFINASRIAEIDISNIADYFSIDLQFSEPEPILNGLRVIWTSHHHDCTKTRFFSWEYQPLTAIEREEMLQLLSLLKEMQLSEGDTRSWGQRLYFYERHEGLLTSFTSNTDRSPHHSFSRQTLEKLKAHVVRQYRFLPPRKYIDLLVRFAGGRRLFTAYFTRCSISVWNEFRASMGESLDDLVAALEGDALGIPVATRGGLGNGFFSLSRLHGI